MTVGIHVVRFALAFDLALITAAQFTSINTFTFQVELRIKKQLTFDKLAVVQLISCMIIWGITPALAGLYKVKLNSFRKLKMPMQSIALKNTQV